MDSRKTVEIMRAGLELLVDQGRFSTTELIDSTECSVSKSETETVLYHLREAEWIKKSSEESPMWVQGPSGNEYLAISNSDRHVFRVLPSEVPDDEPSR